MHTQKKTICMPRTESDQTGNHMKYRRCTENVLSLHITTYRSLFRRPQIMLTGVGCSATSPISIDGSRHGGPPRVVVVGSRITVSWSLSGSLWKMLAFSARGPNQKWSLAPSRNVFHELKRQKSHMKTHFRVSRPRGFRFWHQFDAVTSFWPINSRWPPSGRTIT